jgi:hypothetical protein
MVELTKEEIEKKVNEVKPMVAMNGVGSTLDIVKINGNKVDLKLTISPSFPVFKVKGKIYGPKEVAVDLKKKIEDSLKSKLPGIVISFSD